MASRESIRDKLSPLFEPRQAEALAEVISGAQADSVKAGDFNELKAIVKDLAVAQEKLAGEMRGLAADQRELRQTVQGLAVAQERLAQTMEGLAEDQRELRQTVQGLAEAQQATEAALERLARQVGGLSDRVGGDLEATAAIVQDVLERTRGWKVGELEYASVSWDGRLEEVDFMGRAEDPSRPDQPLWILGEAKVNLTARDVERFSSRTERARRHLAGEVVPVCFCYRAAPEVRRRAQALGLSVVFATGRLAA